MSKFKERLWRDLEREHGSELAQINRPAAGRPRYARPRLLAGTTVGFAVIATAIVLFLSAASTPAAFAVSGNSDGTVSVELRRIAGIKGANAKLESLGVRAKFVQVVAGCRAALPPAALGNIKTPDQVLIHAGRQTRIDPRKIPPGRMLVIVSWLNARKVHVAKLASAVPAAPDCIAGPAPRALRFAWAVAHGCRTGEVKARPNVAIAGRPRGGWTVTRKPGGGVTIDMGPVPGKSGAPAGNSGPFTGNSGAPTGNSDGPVTAVPSPKQIKLAKGCPKPTWFPKPPAPGTAARRVTAATPVPLTAATAEQRKQRKQRHGGHQRPRPPQRPRPRSSEDGGPSARCTPSGRRRRALPPTPVVGRR